MDVNTVLLYVDILHGQGPHFDIIHSKYFHNRSIYVNASFPLTYTFCLLSSHSRRGV